MKIRFRGVFCLEGYWPHEGPSNGLMLPLLKKVKKKYGTEYQHLPCVTLLDFKASIRLWTSPLFALVDVLYLSFHGEKGKIFIGDVPVSLEELAEMVDGRGYGRKIFFSSCDTLT